LPVSPIRGSRPPLKSEGVARQVTQPCLHRPRPLSRTRGRLSARHPDKLEASLGLFADVLPSGAGPRFSVDRLTYPPFLSNRRPLWQPNQCEVSRRRRRPLRQPAPGGQPVVAAERSPGAARVPGGAFISPPAGAASGSIIRRL